MFYKQDNNSTRRRWRRWWRRTSFNICTTKKGKLTNVTYAETRHENDNFLYTSDPSRTINTYGVNRW